jgi:hypothetical protein
VTEPQWLHVTTPTVQAAPKTCAMSTPRSAHRSGGESHIVEFMGQAS